MKLEFETNTSTVPFVDNGFVNEVNFESGSTETMQTLRAGIKAAQDGNRAEARQLLLRVTDAEPHNENAWLWLASISEYPEELLIFLNNVLNINPNNERALEWSKATKSLLSKTFVQRGIDASKESHADFAKQCFLQAIVHDSHNEMAWLWLASVSDAVEEKSAYLQKVLSINPANETASALLQSAKRHQAETQMQKAIAAAVANDRDGANRMLQEVLRQTPELEDAWILKSYLADSFSDKIVCFKKILEINPDNGLAQVNLISLLGMMAKAEPKTEIENFEPIFEVEVVETAETSAETSVSEDEEVESYFAEPTNEEVLEEENRFAEEAEHATEENQFQAETENQFVEEEVEQDDVPTQKLGLLPNFAEKENYSEADAPKAEEESYFEAADVPSNDVPELEFEAAEMNEATELENIEDDFYSSMENSPVEMKSETQESADIYENSVEADNYENTFEEVSGETELVEENLADDEAESVEELQVSGNAEMTFPNYSYVEPEVSDETVAAQPVDEEDFPEVVEDYSAKAEEVEDYSNKTQETEVSMMEEDSEEVAVSMASEDAPEYSNKDWSEYVEMEDEVFTSNAVAENDFAPQYEEAEQHSSAENYAATEDSVVEQVEVEEVEENVAEFEQAEVVEYGADNDYNFQAEKYSAENSHNFQAEENGDKPQVEMIACPFCNSENEANAFVCNSCRALLTLSNLEMLLAHQEVDTERLSQAVERMEVEKNLHEFSSDELKFLGIGQINLKHLRRGFANLQEASKLNQNDVVLSSQVHALAIRLSEIEQQESVHSSMPKNRTILVVDDSATVRKLVSGKLEKCGHEVVCAIDGVDALEKINALVPDLILLDITMPRMDGYQVCKLIRNNEATKDVPIVMISGKDGFFDKVRGRMAGTTGYITKPFGPETLMKTVEAYIVST